MLKGIKYIYHKYIIMKQIFNKYKKYLINGDYIITPYKIYLKGSNFENFNNVKYFFLMKIFFIKNYNIYSDKKFFNGKCIIITSDNSVKIFSDKEVLTFSPKKKIDKLKNITKKIKKYFNLTYREFNENFYKEIFINDEKRIKMEELFDIYKIFLCFYKKQQFTYHNIDIQKVNFSKLSVNNRNFMKFLIMNYKKKINKYPFVLSHNDLHFGNVLKKYSKYYLIDWEYFDVNLFFYDFINILFIEALKGNKIFLENYLKGKLDLVFNQLFKIFNIKYNTNMRKEYIYIYIYYKKLF